MVLNHDVGRLIDFITLPKVCNFMFSYMFCLTINALRLKNRTLFRKCTILSSGIVMLVD